MVKAAALTAGQTLISTDRPGHDARHDYGTIAAVTPNTDGTLTVTFTEKWATTVVLQSFDEVFTS